MKKKIYLILFSLFIILGLISGYQLITEYVDYGKATSYYETLSDTWVKPVPSSPVSQSPSNVSPASGVSPASPDSERPAEPEAAAPAEPSPGQVQPPEEGYAAVPEPPDSETGSPSAGSPGQASATGAPEETRISSEQPPVSVDFTGLLAVNPEIVGWIYCEDTPISFPVLQGSDNKKYLSVQPDGKTSRSGSIFIDCGCPSDFSGMNTIVYGHNRKNGMFATLSNYRKQEYYEAHPVMWMLTPEADYRIDLFAGFIVEAGGWVYRTNFPDSVSRSEYIASCLRSSHFQSPLVPSGEDRIVTLSTCNYTFSGARYVVQGVLTPCAKK